MKFKLHCYTNTKDNELNSTIENIHFDDVKSALQFAKEMAHNNYYLNPIRDILEIMVELKVDEQTAGEVFMNDININTTFYVEEISGEENLIHFDDVD